MLCARLQTAGKLTDPTGRGRLAIGPGRVGPQPGRALPPVGPATLPWPPRPGRPPAAFRCWFRGRILARIRPGDPADPLLLQVCRGRPKTIAAPGYQADPLGEADARCGPGLLRKYQGRILMVATGACAVHCRFCFRRHFPYREASPGRQNGDRRFAANNRRRPLDPRSDPQRRRSADAARRRLGPAWPANWPKSPTSAGCGSTPGCR